MACQATLANDQMVVSVLDGGASWQVRVGEREVVCQCIYEVVAVLKDAATHKGEGV